MDWIIPANNKKYDHAGAFAKWGYIDWKQGKYKYQVGDIIYIYCTEPYKKVMYKAVVDKINLSQDERTDDYAFWNDDAKNEYYASLNGKFMRVKLVEQADRVELGFDELKRNGLNGAPQGAFKVGAELKAYMDKYLIDTYSDGFFPESFEDYSCAEGVKVRVNVNRYERSSIARCRCIELNGCKCCICGIDFEKVYGEVGKGFIHVHHIIPISEINENYIVNYKKDLIPVCPNCHAMLHRKVNGKTLSVEELKAIINR